MKNNCADLAASLDLSSWLRGHLKRAMACGREAEAKWYRLALEQEAAYRQSLTEQSLTERGQQ